MHRAGAQPCAQPSQNSSSAPVASDTGRDDNSPGYLPNLIQEEWYTYNFGDVHWGRKKAVAPLRLATGGGSIRSSTCPEAQMISTRAIESMAAMPLDAPRCRTVDSRPCLEERLGIFPNLLKATRSRRAVIPSVGAINAHSNNGARFRKGAAGRPRKTFMVGQRTPLAPLAVASARACLQPCHWASQLGGS